MNNPNLNREDFEYRGPEPDKGRNKIHELPQNYFAKQWYDKGHIVYLDTECTYDGVVYPIGTYQWTAPNADYTHSGWVMIIDKDGKPVGAGVDVEAVNKLIDAKVKDLPTEAEVNTIIEGKQYVPKDKFATINGNEITDGNAIVITPDGTLDIAQELGDSTTKVVSQKVVTDSIKNVQDNINTALGTKVGADFVLKYWYLLNSNKVFIATGKNLFDWHNVIPKKAIIFKHSEYKIIDDDYHCLSNLIPIDSKGLSFNPKYLGDSRYNIYLDKDLNIIGHILSNVSFIPYIENAKYVVIHFPYNEIDNYIYQVEAGSVQTSYEKFNPVKGYFVDIENKIDEAINSANSAVASSTTKVDKCYGKNLFDTTNASIGKYLNKDGEELSLSALIATDYIPIKPNTDYYYSAKDGNIPATSSSYNCFYDEKLNFISSIVAYNDTSHTYFHTPANAKYIRLTSYVKNAEYQVQLEEGRSRTSYEPCIAIGGYIENDLNGEFPEKALSSAQGKVLSDLINTNADNIASNTREIVSISPIKDIVESKINYSKSNISLNFQSKEDIPLSELTVWYPRSTFSGTGNYIGVVAPFRYCMTYFKSADWEDHKGIVTQIMLELRRKTYNGEVLYTQIKDVNIPSGKTQQIIFDLGEVKTFSDELYLSIRGNNYGSTYYESSILDSPKYPYRPNNDVDYPKTTYYTYGNLDLSYTGSHGTGLVVTFFQLFETLEITTQLNDAQIENISKRLPKSQYDIHLTLPDVMYAVVGTEFNIWNDSVSLSMDRGLQSPLNYVVKWKGSIGQILERCFRFLPTDKQAGKTYSLTCTLYDTQENELDKKVVQINVLSKNALSVKKNIAYFGDSLGRGGAEQLWNNFNNPDKFSGTIPNFLGTKDGGGFHYEAVGGYEWSSYATEGSQGFRIPLNNSNPIGINAVYKDANGKLFIVVEVNISGGSDDNILVRKLYEPETGGYGDMQLPDGTLTKVRGTGDDVIPYVGAFQESVNPLWNDTTHKLDIDQYKDYVKLPRSEKFDAVSFLFGINDRALASDLPTMMGYIDSLYQLFVGDNPNCKFIIGMVPTSGNDYNGCGLSYGTSFDPILYARQVYTIRTFYLTLQNNPQYPNIRIAPTSLGIDRYYGYGFVEKPISQRTPEVTKYHNNYVHPSDVGYGQLADMYFGTYIKALSE